MKLNDFKEEVYKCSGCGLCQSVCPVYKILKTECAVSRGKFKLLNAIINKDINYSKKTLEIMDLCLHCQACSEFCPSGIDAQKIIETAQCDMLSLGILNLPEIFISRIFTQQFYLNMLKIFLNILRKLKILEIMSIFGCKKNKLARSFLKVNIKKEKPTKQTEKTIKALYFKGCINTYINPSCANATENILADTNVEITECNFGCCGLPLKSAGDFDNFIKLAKQNIDRCKSAGEFDYIIFDCSSCKSTFLSYCEFLEGEEKEYAIKISKKIISIYELLSIINYSPKEQNSTITIHYPCHIRGSKEKEILQQLIKNIPSIKFVEMEEADSCCGAAGNFFITNPKLSQKISEIKAENIINTKADIVVTTCPACHIGLKQGLIEKNSNTEVLQLIEFLAK